MNISYTNQNERFYALNPEIDNANRMTFQHSGCTHFLIVSGPTETGMDISGLFERGVLDIPVEGGMTTWNGADLRLVTAPEYTFSGNSVQIERPALCYAVYGCIYSKADNMLRIYIPENKESSRLCIPFTLGYTLSPKMEVRGVFRKTKVFTGYYEIKVDYVDNYQDGTIYYSVGNYRYPIMKQMLGRVFYVKTQQEPSLGVSANEIRLERK